MYCEGHDGSEDGVIREGRGSGRAFPEGRSRDRWAAMRGRMSGSGLGCSESC